MLSVSELYNKVKALKELEAELGVSERTVNLGEDTKSLQDIVTIKKTLATIGYNKLESQLESICSAIKANNLQQLEENASQAYVAFSELYDKTKSAHLVKRFVNAKKADADSDNSYNTVSLKEALKYIDYEEANRKLRILAVDDVAVVLNTLTSILSADYEVFALKNSSQVEKFLAHTTPELFLLDIEMSEVNGFDLVPLIRRFKEHKDTPIIFLTGNASLNNLKDAVALGACDFITKPVDRDILLEKIQKNIVRKNICI